MLRAKSASKSGLPAVPAFLLVPRPAQGTAVEAREDAGAVPTGPPVVGFGPQRVPVQRVPQVVLLDGCEFAEGGGEGGVSIDGVDRKLDVRVSAEQVFLGEAEVEQPELLTLSLIHISEPTRLLSI